jgi:putative membrane protein
MWHMDDGSGWWMLIGSVWFVVFWGVLIWAIFRLTEHRDYRERGSESAIEILRQRYARGEIGKEEFNRIRHDLES